MRRSSRLPGSAVVLMAGGATFGCAAVPDLHACPAIGLGSTLSVTLEPPVAGLRLVLCDGDGCLAELPEPAVPIDPSARDYTIRGTSETGWSASRPFEGAPVLGYRLTDAARTLVTEGYVDVAWVRVDGSEQCGGNVEASVVLDIPG